MKDTTKILAEFDKKFGFYEIYICADCGHTKEDHYWNGGGHVEYGGYDMCKADNCKCVSENWKIEKQKEENKALKDFLTTSIAQAVMKAEVRLGLQNFGILQEEKQKAQTTLLERIKKMKKRELRSPRSIGDNESTVDVSSGYNQGIDDVLSSLDEPFAERTNL